MDIDKRAIANLHLNFLETDIEDILGSKIHDILEKYNIIIDPLLKADNTCYILLQEFILNEYYKKNIDIPLDLKEFIKYDHGFRTFLLSHISKSIDNLLLNSNQNFFYVLEDIINMLSLGNHYLIFIDDNNYSIPGIHKMLRMHEKFLSEVHINEKQFDTTFAFHIEIIEALKQLCIINAIDIQRKRSIKDITDAIIESINILKFTIMLDEKKIDVLNNILGEILYQYSHVPYVETDGKEIDYLIKEFLFTFEKQIDGYNLSLETDFGNNISRRDKEYLLFVTNSSYLILLLIKKVEEGFYGYDLLNDSKFRELIGLYYKNHSHVNQKKFNTIRQFENELLNNISHNYKVKNNNFIHNQQNVIDHFILDGRYFEDNNIETLHNILLFSKDISDKRYVDIGTILLKKYTLKNSFHEYFKLKILDTILHKLTAKFICGLDLDPFILEIIDYIEKNESNDYLDSIISKIYLSIALYSSYCKGDKNFLKSKNYYQKFKERVNYDLLSSEYNNIYKSLMCNYGKFLSKGNKKALSEEEYIEIGSQLIENTSPII